MLASYKALYFRTASLSSVHPNRESREPQGSLQTLKHPLLQSLPTSSERPMAGGGIYQESRWEMSGCVIHAEGFRLAYGGGWGRSERIWTLKEQTEEFAVFPKLPWSKFSPWAGWHRAKSLLSRPLKIQEDFHYLKSKAISLEPVLPDPVSWNLASVCIWGALWHCCWAMCQIAGLGDRTMPANSLTWS